MEVESWDPEAAGAAKSCPWAVDARKTPHANRKRHFNRIEFIGTTPFLYG
jgi:hypothetical protein